MWRRVGGMIGMRLNGRSQESSDVLTQCDVHTSLAHLICSSGVTSTSMTLMRARPMSMRRCVARVVCATLRSSCVSGNPACRAASRRWKSALERAACAWVGEGARVKHRVSARGGRLGFGCWEREGEARSKHKVSARSALEAAACVWLQGEGRREGPGQVDTRSVQGAPWSGQLAPGAAEDVWGGEQGADARSAPGVPLHRLPQRRVRVGR